MKTAVKPESIDAYYARIVAPGVENSQVDQVVAYVITHPCCTRRQIAAHFKSLNPDSPLAQEARVSARVNKALERNLIEEGLSPVKDAVTGLKAMPLYRRSSKPQRDLFFDRPALHTSGVSEG